MSRNDGYGSDPMSQIRSPGQSEPRFSPYQSPANHGNYMLNQKGRWDRGGERIRGKAAEEFEYSNSSSPNMSYVNSMLSEEGGTSNLSRGSHAYPSEMTNMDDVDRIGDDLTEILIKYGEIRDQLSRFGYSTGKGKTKAFLGRRMARQNSKSWYPDSSPEPPFSTLSHQNRHFQPSPSMLRQESCHGFFNHPRSSRSYMDDDATAMAYLDSFGPAHRHVNRHHSSRSFFQPTHFQENPAPFGRRGFEFRDVNSDFDALAPALLPIAGGSPFIVCRNCFELLLLPERAVTKTSNNYRKIKCGVCSNLVVFPRSDKKSAAHSGMESTDTTAAKVDDSGFLSPIREELYKNRDRDTFSSDDYDDVGCDFQPAAREADEPPLFEGRAKNSSTMKRLDPVSTRETKPESSTENGDVTKTELGKEVKQEEPSPSAGTLLREHVECSNKFDVKKHRGEENASGNDKSLPSKNTTRRISFSDLPSGPVTDMSSGKSYEKGTSFDSGDGSGRKGRTAGSFLASIVKRSFKEVKRRNRNVEQEKGNVTVNGRLIPDEMIKLAEKMAGPIGPGSYWYDYGAGFWGVIGGPCLGILPPYIEEFNYPMPEKCAGGDTDIYVNGRELNQKDINLLSQRGLPADRNRSYYIDISGRVLDNHTGEELESLGKLAPTIERLRRGFGMRIPRELPHLLDT